MSIVKRLPLIGTLNRATLRVLPGLRAGLIDVRGRVGPRHPGATPVQRPPWWLANLFGPTRTRFSPDWAEQVLGWRPVVSLEEGQVQTRRWLEAWRYAREGGQ